MKRFSAMLALCLASAGAMAATKNVQYYHTDALGSPAVITDETGAIVARHYYEPYGALVNESASDGPGYAGHVSDGKTGLSYMQQRYYDPGVGRFLSVDAVTALQGGPQHFTRYAYAYNNPYTFTDPDGRCPDANPCHEATPANFFRDNIVGKVISHLVGDPIAVLRPDNLNPLSNEVLSPGQIQDAKVGMALLAAPLARAEGAVARGISNPVPATMARVIPEGVPATTLGAPSASDVFVTAADDIAGMTSTQIAETLAIPASQSGFRVIEFATPNGVASPVFRTNPGFVGGGRTAGGAREFVVPNKPIPPDATQRVVP